jgi:hypothetical protein
VRPSFLLSIISRFAIMSSAGVDPQMLQYNNIVLHHVPNALAPGLLAAMLVYAFCLGIIFLEVLGNIGYDYALLKRKGWSEPIKASNRFAYFLSRYGAFVFLTMTIIYMNNSTSSNEHCRRFAIGVNVMWILPLIFVDLIFVQRTLAVYGWHRAMVAFLGTIYVCYSALSIYAIVEFGYGYQIPNSQFCAYQVRPTNVQPHAGVFIGYISLTILLDTLILTLTTHRLIEGGLLNLPNLIVSKSSDLRRDRAARKAAGHATGEISLSGLLLRQGVGYFIILEGSRLAFLIVYYTLNNSTSYQILVSGILGTVGPVMAGMLFRQTSEAVKRTAVFTSRSGGEAAQVQSFGRSYRSSLGVTPAGYSSNIPLTPRENQLTNANLDIVSPNGSKGSQSDRGDEESTAYPFYAENRHSAGADSINTGHVHDLNPNDEQSLRIFVEEKTDVQTSTLRGHGSTSRSASLRKPAPKLEQSEVLTDGGLDEEEGLPIHQRYMRSPMAGSNSAYFGPASSQGHGSAFVVEDNTAFTPVSNSARASSHYEGFGQAR